jgi:hypothetical protein
VPGFKGNKETHLVKAVHLIVNINLDRADGNGGKVEPEIFHISKKYYTSGPMMRREKRILKKIMEYQ